MSDDQWRWEYCPYCKDGWPDYVGEKKGFHVFNCSLPECEAQFRVEAGFGNYDMRLGMKLSKDVIYYEKCDGCRTPKPVKVKNLRFICSDCFKK